jgi:hypothetical protein
MLDSAIGITVSLETKFMQIPPWAIASQRHPVARRAAWRHMTIALCGAH